MPKCIPAVISHFGPPDSSDNCNVSVLALDDAVLALTETRTALSVDPDGLGVLRRVRLGERVDGQTTIAHPHIGSDQRLFNIVTSFKPRSHNNFYQQATSTQSTAQLIAFIPVSRLAYLHSFGMTANWLVLTEYPFTASAPGMRLTGALRRSYIVNFV